MATVSNAPLTNYEVAGDVLDGQENQWVVSRPFAVRIDEASASVTYFGWAVPGSSESASVWRVVKQTVSGAVTKMEFADGDTSFDNDWSNRASLIYS